MCESIRILKKKVYFFGCPDPKLCTSGVFSAPSSHFCANLASPHMAKKTRDGQIVERHSQGRTVAWRSSVAPLLALVSVGLSRWNPPKKRPQDALLACFAPRALSSFYRCHFIKVASYSSLHKKTTQRRQLDIFVFLMLVFFFLCLADSR